MTPRTVLYRGRRTGCGACPFREHVTGRRDCPGMADIGTLQPYEQSQQVAPDVASCGTAGHAWTPAQVAAVASGLVSHLILTADSLTGETDDE